MNYIINNQININHHFKNLIKNLIIQNFVKFIVQKIMINKINNHKF